jgi:hypothetical protein
VTVKSVECASFNCENQISYDLGDDKTPLNSNVFKFCEECRSKHSITVLELQNEHENDIRSIILEASKVYSTCSKISDYLGVSFVTIYNWIRIYFNMSFSEFKREHICKSKGCHLVDISRCSYSRLDYVLKKVQQEGYCSCINALDSGMVMTKAPPSVIEGLLRGFPKIERIHDNVFRVAPNPVRGLGKKIPYRFTKDSLVDEA